MSQLEYIQLLGAMVHGAALEHLDRGTSPVVIERELSDSELFQAALSTSRDLTDWCGPCMSEYVFGCLTFEV